MYIRYVFTDQDLRKSHDGFTKVLQDEKLTLRTKEFALFLNTKQSMFKMMSGDSKLCISYKSPFGRVNPRMLLKINNYWDGSTLNFKKAEKEALLSQLKAKSKRSNTDKKRRLH